MMRAWVSLALLLASAPAAAQPPDVDDGDMVVEGRTRAAIHNLASTIAAPGTGGVIPRHRDMVCISVKGLGADYGEVVASRVLTVAKEAGLPVSDRPDCRPNIVVLAPAEPDTYTDAIIRDHWMLIGDPANGVPPRSLLNDLRRPRPVRWFSATRSIALGSGMWRLAAPARVDKLATYIIIDVTQMKGISWSQLSDYIAMVALANPGLNDRYPPAATALSLFADRDAGRTLVKGRTAFDRSLLRAVYSVDSHLNAKLQEQRIVDDIAKGRHSDPDGAD